jgi:GT2 family glycosyltransferase
MNKYLKILPRVYLITGVNNNWEYTDKFLKCAMSQDYENLEVVVVDDGSTDGTKEKIKKYYPEVTVLLGSGDLWWTGCMYDAVEYVQKHAKSTDFFLPMNNDCTFSPDYVSNIVKSASYFKNSIIGSVSISNRDKKTIVDSGAMLDWKRGRVYKAGLNNLTDVPKNLIYDSDVDTLSTRGTLFPVSIIKKIGNFDKKHLPHYVSDFEYTCRAKKHGYRLVVDYSSLVYNDNKRTGSSGPADRPISFGQLKKMLFGRKSQINIIDHFYFIYLCCPWYLQPINYLYLIAKLIYLSSFLTPFFPFRKPLVKLRALLLFNVK